ncbi:hypothetical protein CCICO_00415 [Corynebacterium ciconiae DSM 44920]|uniref:hypothetical protein n=1 Tax=Corynebacterium ciconiae TaxID=227319 RepID=UPI000361C91D|nr:hypothetical protein [Corynebacterium ciconiae]WKD60146.1 hypothetical protein CCICO_00415 [Corynebacterium ciconiae DSM 44920]
MGTRTAYSKATKASAIALAAGLCIAGLTACNDDDTAAAPSATETPTTTITKTTTTTVTPDDSADNNAPQSSSSESSTGASRSEAEDIALAEARKAMDSDGLFISDSSAYDPDKDVSYILLDDENVRSYLMVALFHKGSFQQFAGDNRLTVANAKEDPNGVEVSFVDSKAFRESGDPLAFMYSHTKSVVYYWDGDHISYKGELPDPPELP